MNDDLLLGQLAEEFTHRMREGKLPDVEEYASRYPELAGRIRELFPTLMLLEGMAAANGTTFVYPWELFAPYDDLLVLARSRVTRSLSCEERHLYLQSPPCPAAKQK
jgi:hypothetical protein